MAVEGLHVHTVFHGHVIRALNTHVQSGIIWNSTRQSSCGKTEVVLANADPTEAGERRSSALDTPTEGTSKPPTIRIDRRSTSDRVHEYEQANEKFIYPAKSVRGMR